MDQNSENVNESGQSTENRITTTFGQPLSEGMNGVENCSTTANFPTPPDPTGTGQMRQEQLIVRPSVNLTNSSEFSPPISSNFTAIPTLPLFNFAPPPADFPLQLKILHILMAHIGVGERKEKVKVTCRLQSPSAVAKGQLGFVVEHELGPFNRTNNVFAEHRFRDLERRSQASVTEFSSKFVELAPPSPMNTLTLLCMASDQLQMDPQMTIETARKLNKIGLISSPLTNGDRYSPGFPRKEMVGAVVLHLDELCGVRLNAQEILTHFVRPIHRLGGSAEPIHPVLVDHNETKYRKALNDDQTACRLYELICRYFLATCMCPSKIADMTIKFSIGPEVFKSVKHSVFTQGFLLVVPWLRPEYHDTELPSEATKQQSQFIKQAFIVSDVRRLHIENPKGGLSESKLIVQMALLGLGNYDSIPETLNKLVQKKLINVVGPGRWIVPTSEGLQKLESFRRDEVEMDCDNEQASENSEEQNECEQRDDIYNYPQSVVTKRVRFALPPDRMRSKSVGPRQRGGVDPGRDRSPIGRRRRAPSPEPGQDYYSNGFKMALDRSHSLSHRARFNHPHHFDRTIGNQQRNHHFRDHFRERDCAVDRSPIGRRRRSPSPEPGQDYYSNGFKMALDRSHSLSHRARFNHPHHFDRTIGNQQRNHHFRDHFRERDSGQRRMRTFEKENNQNFPPYSANRIFSPTFARSSPHVFHRSHCHGSFTTNAAAVPPSPVRFSPVFHRQFSARHSLPTIDNGRPFFFKR